jgi:hypothetical protein
MGAGSENGLALFEKSQSVIEYIRKLSPLIAEVEFGKRLADIAEAPTNWQNGDDFIICKNLRTLSNELDRMHRLKGGGVDGFPDVVATPLKELVASLRKTGIFLAPVGELEGWLASENISESKTNKAAWANAAALKVQAVGPRTGDIWDFLREVGSYLRQGRS